MASFANVFTSLCASAGKTLRRALFACVASLSARELNCREATGHSEADE